MYTPTRLFNPRSLGSSMATLHTVPSGFFDLLKQLIAANTSDSDVRLSVSLVPSGQVASLSNRLVPGSIVPARSVVTFDMSQVLNAGDFIAAQGESVNRLTMNDASFESSINGWSILGSTTIARTTLAAAHGAASMRVFATVATTLQVVTTAKYSVIRGRSYSAKASFRSPAVSRNCRVQIQWLREDDSVISTSDSGPFPGFLSVFRELTVRGISPAEAVAARISLVIDSAGANEDHYVDKVQFAEGDASVPWINPDVPGLVLTGSGVRRGIT